MSKHPGIRIDRIRPAGAVGLIFTLGGMVILLHGVPELREFFVLTLVVGLGFAVLFAWRRRS